SGPLDAEWHIGRLSRRRVDIEEVVFKDVGIILRNTSAQREPIVVIGRTNVPAVRSLPLQRRTIGTEWHNVNTGFRVAVVRRNPKTTHQARKKCQMLLI